MRQQLIDPVSELLSRVQGLEPHVAHRAEHLAADMRRVLIAATRLDELTRALPDGIEPVLSSVARHDLMNSLNQIIGFGEILLEETVDTELTDVAEGVQSVVTAARHLTSRIEGTSGRASGSAPAPVSTDSPAPAARVRPLPKAANPILVVDDEPLNREMLAALLRRNGLDVIEAEDGLRALAVLEQQPIDLVLLDVMMPRLDGYGVLQRMNANASLHDVPVLVISGLSEIESVVRCIESGAADYLPKPFNHVLLWARIGACLEKKALRDQEREALRALEESQARLAAELAEAAEYVRSLLPSPIAGAISIDWRFLPSTHLGGDAVGYHWIDPKHLALYVIDVCGHGVGAALLAVSVTHVLRSKSLHDTDFLDPAAVLERLNAAFPMDEHNGQYFTMWYGVYDVDSRYIRFASGGHPPALLVSSEGARDETVARLGRPGLIIGGMPDITFECSQAHLPPGSRLFVFSDGAYEITRPDGSMLWYDEFQKMLTTLATKSQHPLDALVAALRALRGNNQFEDDVSVMEIVFR
jgi:sigma-B regulation protein RsbU (phosphoserine phosphatase)